MVRLTRWLLTGAVAWFAWVHDAQAQADWAAVASGTSANLWGVCYGGGQFVAVGESGTILTSSDGIAWQAHSSGTMAWLTSVTYASNQYVAVGDVSTVLVSADAVTWTGVTNQYPALPRARLNVVHFIRGEFLIYGEHDAAERVVLPVALDWHGSEIAGGHWWRSVAPAFDRNFVGGETGIISLAFSDPFMVEPTPVAAGAQKVTGILPDRGGLIAVGASGAIVGTSDGVVWKPQPSGVSADLNGIASFNNTLVVVGNGGTILSRDEHDAWVRRASPTSQLLLGVASSPDAAIIVGTGGTILRSTPAAVAPVIVNSPQSVSETIGGAASFVVTSNGSLPLQYQWLHDGTAILNATDAVLTIAPISGSDAGTYTIRVTNSAGVATASGSLTTLPRPSAVVDPTFDADATLTGAPTLVFALPDSSVLMADAIPGELIKLKSDGSLDPAWHAGVLTSGAIAVIVRQPDGRLLVGGSFQTYSGTAATYLVRLNRDGAVDSSFRPMPALTGPVTGLALQADDKILVANGGKTPVRLLSDGQADSSFAPQPLDPIDSPSQVPQKRDWAIRDIGVDSLGRIVIGAEANLTYTVTHPLFKLAVARLLNDGAPDASFTPFQADGRFAAMRVLTDNGVTVVTGDRWNAKWAPVFYHLTASGSLYPGDVSPTFDAIGALHLFANGTVVLNDRTHHRTTYLSALGAVAPAIAGGIGDATVIDESASGQLYVAGPFTLYDAVPSNRVARLNRASNDAVNPPQILALRLDRDVVAVGDKVTVRAAVTGSANLTYEWYGASTGGDGAVVTAEPALTFVADSPGTDRWVTLVVRNAKGDAISSRLDFSVNPTAIRVVDEPAHVSAQSGRDLALHVGVDASSGQLTSRWSKDGQPIANTGFDPYTLYLSRVSAADAGSYTVIFTNTLGQTVTAPPMRLTIDDSSRFVNLSTRARVAEGEAVLIAGFVVPGIQARTLVIRAVGPSLASYGVSDPLPNPQITLYNENGTPINASAFVSAWDLDADRVAFAERTFSAVGAFAFDPGAKDAWGMVTLAPGRYSVGVTGAPGETGTAMVEVYEYDNVATRILNLSSRTMVAPNSPAIAGLAIRGPVPKRVLVRGVGPTLSKFGVARPLSNPRVTIRNEAGAIVGANDDWSVGEANAVTDAADSVGAFALPEGGKDAAVVLTLPAGNYTIVAEGPANETGIVLIEAYEL